MKRPLHSGAVLASSVSPADRGTRRGASSRLSNSIRNRTRRLLLLRLPVGLGRLRHARGFLLRGSDSRNHVHAAHFIVVEAELLANSQIGQLAVRLAVDHDLRSE